LVLGHEDHSTFKLSAAAKGALVNTAKAAELTKFLLESLTPDLKAIESQANEVICDITGMGTELIQNILLLYNHQMKSASRQRDNLIHDICIATDCMDVAMTLNAQKNQSSCSSLAMKLLRKKRDKFPLHVDFTKPRDISMGRLRQADGTDGVGFILEYEDTGSVPTCVPDHIYARVVKPKPAKKEGIYEMFAPVHQAESAPPCSPTYEELVSQGVSPLHAVRRSNSKTESDAIRVRPKRHSSAKIKAIPSMNLYRGINGYQLEDCGSTFWDFLPKFRFAFSLALLSDTRHAFLTSKSSIPLQDLADTIIIFNTDGSSQNVITENVQGSRRMITNEAGEIVLLQTDPPCIRTLLSPEGENGQNTITIPELKDPTSIDVDEQDNYYINHGGKKEAKLSVLDDIGSLVTSIPLGDHRYVNYAGNNFIFTLSRTSISSYEWRGDKLCLNKTGKHGVENFEIYGSCCNGFGDLFMVGWMTTDKPREICLYQLLDGEDGNEWRLLRLDSGQIMKCNQEPRISYWNGHILIAFKESMKTCCSRRFKLSTIRRKSITVYDSVYDDSVLQY
jgi:hypothetical protein